MWLCVAVCSCVVPVKYVCFVCEFLCAVAWIGFVWFVMFVFICLLVCFVNDLLRDVVWFVLCVFVFVCGG